MQHHLNRYYQPPIIPPNNIRISIYRNEKENRQSFAASKRLHAEDRTSGSIDRDSAHLHTPLAVPPSLFSISAEIRASIEQRKLLLARDTQQTPKNEPLSRVSVLSNPQIFHDRDPVNRIESTIFRSLRASRCTVFTTRTITRKFRAPRAYTHGFPSMIATGTRTRSVAEIFAARIGQRFGCVFKLGCCRICGFSGAVRNFKLERGFRGGRLSAWNLKIMRVLILRRLGDCSGRLVTGIKLVSFFAPTFNG